MASNKLQDDINNIPLADDDPQGKNNCVNNCWYKNNNFMDSSDYI